MPTLNAEIQVAGHCEPLDKFVLTLHQPTDYVGRPNGTVVVNPIQLTLTGTAAVQAFFTKWSMDSHMRRSGYIVMYEQMQTRWRLSFYDAWCVIYESTFQPGSGAASYQLILALSPAAVDINGLHVERHSDLWWEKDPVKRLTALTKPADPLPSPGLRTALPGPAQNLTPSPTLSPLTGAPQLPRPPKTALDPKKKPKYAPTVAKWYKKGGSIEQLADGSWKYTDWEHNSVVYVGGFPVFEPPHKRQEVDIPNMQGNCTTDYTAARERAPLGRELDTSTWHHHQNLVTMQEVSEEIHARFTHFGARAIIKAKKPGAKIRKRNA
jgi:hypothetical protein